MTQSVNIAHYIPELATSLSDQVAIRYLVKNQYQSITFKEFHHLTNRYANGFARQGIEKGSRVLMLVKHTLDFYAVVFALFKLGAVPVVIDPGMKKKDLLKCIEQAEAYAMISIPLGHIISWLYPKYFKNIKMKILVGQNSLVNSISLSDLNKGDQSDVLVKTNATDLAAILFTSGSTGVPKGVEYEHDMFDHQAQSIKNLYSLKSGDIDLPCFPLFGLFSLVAGVTLVLPKMDPSKPAKVKPQNIVDPIHKFSITNCFASPAVWNKVADYCNNQNIKLKSLKTALAAGAPVQPWLIEKIMKMLTVNGEFHTPYGATESLPVSTITGSRILNETRLSTEKGKGICVGRPVSGVQVKIISIQDGAIEKLKNISVLKNNEIGEIIINSPMVTKRYFRSESKTANAKIVDGEIIWHRIGDVGYLDDNGDLWFCGRKDHRVVIGSSTLFTIPCESIFNTHQKVFRTALVGHTYKKLDEPVLVVELKDIYKKMTSVEKQKIVNEMFLLGQSNSISKRINKFIFHPMLPVDVRHNAKINREHLREWVKKRKDFFIGSV